MQDNRLTSLLTYTVFHLGAYATLVTALIGAGIFGKVGKQLENLLRWAVGWFLIAGLCGAVVGSNIPNYVDFNSFYSDHIGFWWFRFFTPPVWIQIEHLAFWIGFLPIVIAFIFRIGAFKQKGKI